jgi:undecaprenyl-diphosphatase
MIDSNLPATVLRLLPLILAAVVIAASAFGFYELASDYRTSVSIARFDDEMTQRIQGWRNPALDVVMKIITYSAGIFGMTLLTFALWLYLRHIGRSPEATATAFLVIGGVALSDCFKLLLRRVRPEEALALIKTPVTSSFPSGHSMSALCWSVAAANAILLAPSASLPVKALVCALAVIYTIAAGISRVYLGVHYPSDVLAAWLLGLVWVAGVMGFYYWRWLRLPGNST